jgi:hypothetical protein
VVGVAGFDFKRLAGSSTSDVTEPATLFDALPNKTAGYGYARAVQKTVWDTWSGRRGDRDLVIKTNTGGGKTIAGLVILQCCLNEGLGPAMYVAPEPDLAARVIEEANNLGLAVVDDDPEAPAFLSGRAILVTTLQKVINGQTRYGMIGGRPPVTVRSLVVDDAHAALARTHESTRLTIPKSHDAYVKLLELFEDDLAAQNKKALLDILDDDHTATMRVPFWAWDARKDEVLAQLHPYRGDNVFKWAWPAVADILTQCEAVVTTDAVEIVPLCPPIEKFPAFHEADRRIYLTATLADDSVLVTHFDADPKSIADPIVPDSAADLGDRLFIAPQELNPQISHDDVQDAVAGIAKSHNVVVLVPSKAKAKLWADVSSLTVSTSADVENAVEQLKAGHVGVVVIINRYDGIDLPDKACRLLVIDGLPYAYNGAERREAVALRDSDAMVTRQLQRFEQGSGRGVRSRDDRCVVLVLDKRLVALISRLDVADRLSPATQAQLELSRKFAGELEGSGITMAELVPIMAQVIDNDQGFREASRSALVGVNYGPPYLSPTAEPLRKAYNAAIIGRTQAASEYAGAAVQAAVDAGDLALAGWLGETLATYLQPVDEVRAQGALATASERNRAVLRPIAGVEYKKVKASGTQAQQSSTYLTSRYNNGSELVLGVEAMLDDITWDKDRWNETEEALYELGLHLGFIAQRPERDFLVGSDVMWILEHGLHAVIEAKTGATGPTIWKSDINQLAGSVNWCESTYPGADAVPVIVHPSTVVDKAGTPPSGTRGITVAKMEALEGQVRAFAIALAVGDSFKDPQKVLAQLQAHGLVGKAIISNFTLPVTKKI